MADGFLTVHFLRGLNVFVRWTCCCSIHGVIMKHTGRCVSKRLLPVLFLALFCSCTAGPDVLPSRVQPMGTMEEGERVIHVWAMQYEFVPGQVVVREGEDVRLVLRTIDVKHGLAIPALNAEATVEDDQVKTLEFTPDKPGRFAMECSAYCGLGHMFMEGQLIVLPAKEESDDNDEG